MQGGIKSQYFIVFFNPDAVGYGFRGQNNNKGGYGAEDNGADDGYDLNPDLSGVPENKPAAPFVTEGAAKSPVARAPHIPHKPCILKASRESS